MSSTLFIDFGHGGRDPGAVHNGTTESKEVRLACAGSAMFFSRVSGAVVVPEFEDHPVHSIMLRERMNWVNRIATKHDRLVSIHMNASSNDRATGVEVLHYKGGYQRMLADYLSDMMSYYLDLPNRGAKVDTSYGRDSGLAICRGVPYGFVLECGFISNKDDLAAFRDRGGYAITAALARWTSSS